MRATIAAVPGLPSPANPNTQSSDQWIEESHRQRPFVGLHLQSRWNIRETDFARRVSLGKDKNRKTITPGKIVPFRVA
jgi:hypothetical protein